MSQMQGAFDWESKAGEYALILGKLEVRPQVACQCSVPATMIVKALLPLGEGANSSRRYCFKWWRHVEKICAG